MAWRRGPSRVIGAAPCVATHDADAEGRMTTRTYTLRTNPTMGIEIDGRPYEVQLGNVSFLLDADEWQRGLERLAKPGAGPDDVRALAESGRAIVASALGDEAANELVGGENRLNLYRLIDMVRILADAIDSDEAMGAMAGAAASDASTLELA